MKRIFPACGESGMRTEWHTINQSLGEWYNRRNRRVGPMWAGRFKSLIVKGCGHALLAVEELGVRVIASA